MEKIDFLRRMAAAAMCCAALAGVAAEGDTLNVGAEFLGGGASRAFNPYLLGSNNHGKTPMGATALVGAFAEKGLDRSRRFSWEAGAEGYTGYQQKADYMRYDGRDKDWYTNPQGPSAVWLQQLWAGIKYRSLELWAGMRQTGSALVDDRLSSGDLIHSPNARPVPQVSAGFVDFQDIPFTRRWVQINGAISYGKMTQNGYLENHANLYSGHYITGSLYTYKRIQFRSNPQKPLTVTIGMEAAGLFGGTYRKYYAGAVNEVRKNPAGLKTFFNMLIPRQGTGHDGFYEGSHLGTWDFRADYTLRGHHRISGYFQWFWEDGSSMARRNKWDGLWGLQYRRLNTSGVTYLRSAVAEYIDFRDQSGPVFWGPGDRPGTSLTGTATGGDFYYNNAAFNSYANYGMSLGSPFFVSPVYNTNGSLDFLHNCARGVHLGAEGDLSPKFTWRALFAHSAAYSPNYRAHNYKLRNTSALAECSWRADSLLPGLAMSAALAFDAGSLRGNNWGALLAVRYNYSTGF